MPVGIHPDDVAGVKWLKTHNTAVYHRKTVNYYFAAYEYDTPTLVLQPDEAMIDFAPLRVGGGGGQTKKNRKRDQHTPRKVNTKKRNAA